MDSLLDELKELGVDTEEACQRVMGKTDFYERMLKKFVATALDLEVMSYLQEGDYEKALEHAHTMKGVTGNLSLTPLFSAYTDIVAALRANENEKAKQLLEDILPVQESIIACIERSTS
jgi:HPt (histidine-containing phosphotransfer) domain-containing protein